jgi:hypothetical protein
MTETAYEHETDRPDLMFVYLAVITLFYVSSRIFGLILSSEEFAAIQMGIPQSMVKAAGALPTILFSAGVSLALALGMLYALRADLSSVSDWNAPQRTYLWSTGLLVVIDVFISVPLAAVGVAVYAVHRRLRIGF